MPLLTHYLIAILLILTNSLHLHSEQSRQAAYIQNMKDLQAELVSTADSLHSQIDETIQKLKQEEDIDLKIIQIEKIIQKNRDHLTPLAFRFKYDLNQSTSWVCPALSGEGNNIIVQNINTVKSLNQEINTNFELLDENSAIKGDLKNTVWINNEATTNLKSSVYASNRQIDIADYHPRKMPNLVTPLWIFGKGNSKENLVGKVTQEIKYGQVKMCMNEKPFNTQTNNCSICPNEKPYFDVSQQKCIQCLNFDIQSRTCKEVKNFFMTNFDSQKSRIVIPPGQDIENLKSNPTSLPICPQGTPYFNGFECIDCTYPLVFDVSSSSCQTCPVNQYYNKTQHTCLFSHFYSNLSNKNWQSTKKTVQKIQQQVVIQKSMKGKVPCPIQTPFFNKIECISCNEPDQHFNYDSYNCTSCKQETEFDANVHKCIKLGNLDFQTNPVNTSNLIFAGKPLGLWVNVYYQNKQKYLQIEDCPKEKPFFDGSLCIKCHESFPYFNLQTRTCVICDGSTTYDTKIKECVNSKGKGVRQVATFQKMAASIFA